MLRLAMAIVYSSDDTVAFHGAPPSMPNGFDCPLEQPDSAAADLRALGGVSSCVVRAVGGVSSCVVRAVGGISSCVVRAVGGVSSCVVRAMGGVSACVVRAVGGVTLGAQMQIHDLHVGASRGRPVLRVFWDKYMDAWNSQERARGGERAVSMEDRLVAVYNII